MSTQRIALAIAAALASLALAACGAESQAADEPKVPDVRGLVLPEAKTELKAAGYGVSVKDDSLFGVLIEEHFTVCKQHDPKGHLVPLDVSKDC
jgi:hypothetical protein